MLIPTYYLLSKIWDIFATRRRILLEINKNYFRGGEVKTNNIIVISAQPIGCALILFMLQPKLPISADFDSPKAKSIHYTKNKPSIIWRIE